MEVTTLIMTASICVWGAICVYLGVLAKKQSALSRQLKQLSILINESEK